MLSIEIERLRDEAARHRQAAAQLRESRLFQFPATRSLCDQEQVAPGESSTAHGTRGLRGSYDPVEPLRASAPRQGVNIQPTDCARLTSKRTHIARGGTGSRQGTGATEVPAAPPASVIAMQQRTESLRARRAALEDRRRQAEREAIAQLQQEIDLHKAEAAAVRKRVDSARPMRGGVNGNDSMSTAVPSSDAGGRSVSSMETGSGELARSSSSKVDGASDGSRARSASGERRQAMSSGQRHERLEAALKDVVAGFDVPLSVSAVVTEAGSLQQGTSVHDLLCGSVSVTPTQLCNRCFCALLL